MYCDKTESMDSNHIINELHVHVSFLAKWRDGFNSKPDSMHMCHLVFKANYRLAFLYLSIDIPHELGGEDGNHSTSSYNIFLGLGKLCGVL